MSNTMDSKGANLIWISERSKTLVDKKIASFQKKAERLSMDIPSIQYTGNSRIVEVAAINPTPYMDEFYAGKELVKQVEILISGEVPHVNGFRFLAKIEHSRQDELGNNLNVVTSSYGLSDDDRQYIDDHIESLSVCSPGCDHCSKNIFRSNTFILKNDASGEVYQVGSTCVNDFLGSSSLEQALLRFDINYFLENIDELDRDVVMGAGATQFHVPVELVLAVGYAVTERYGFVPTSEEYGNNLSTRTRITSAFINDRDKEFNDVIEGFYRVKNGLPVDNPYVEKGKAVADWIMKHDGDGSFWSNCRVIAQSGYVDMYKRNEVGIVASLPKIMLKDSMRVEINNEFFGNVKERGELKLKLTDLKYNPGDGFSYPSTTYYFLDDENRKFRWKSSNIACPQGSEYEIEIGKHYVMKATISNHNEYNGHKSTWINRAQGIVEVEPNTPSPPFIKPKKRSKRKGDPTLSVPRPTEDFLKWFGGSAIKTPGGEPLLVYHGSEDAFDTFRDGLSYFSPDTRYGYVQRSRVVYPCYLSIQKPYRTTDQRLVEQLRSNPERVEALKQQGYDGVIYSYPTTILQGASGWGNDYPQYVVFSNQQIMSAIDCALVVKQTFGYPDQDDVDVRFDIGRKVSTQ